GLTEDAGPASLLVPAHDAVIRNVAPQETARITEIDRALVKTAARREPLDAGKRQPIFVKGRIETLHRWVRIALARLPGRRCRRRIFHGGFSPVLCPLTRRSALRWHSINCRLIHRNIRCAEVLQLTRSPRRRGRAASAALRVRAPWRRSD